MLRVLLVLYYLFVQWLSLFFSSCKLTVNTLLCSSMYVLLKSFFKPNTELAFFSAGHNIKILHSTYFGSLGNGVIDQICFFRDATTMSCWQQPVAKKE